MRPDDDQGLKPNRRRYPRFNVKLPVEFTILGEQRRCRATVDNISLAGILLITEEALENGARIIVHMLHGGARSLDVQGQVVRASVVGEFGVAFVALSEAEVEHLTSFVERLT